VVLQHANRYYQINKNGLREKVKARAKKAYAEHPQKQYERNRTYELKWPGKVAARRAVHSATRHGRLIKQPCAVCGSILVHAHHEDYSKPLEVIWLCRDHHGEAHRAINRGRASDALWACKQMPEVK
jgi:hypothetical protein